MVVVTPQDVKIVIQVITFVYEVYRTVKNHKELCSRLKDTCESFETPLNSLLRNRAQLPSVNDRALSNLKKAIEESAQFMQVHGRKTLILDVLRCHKIKDEYTDLMSRLLQTSQILQFGVITNAAISGIEIQSALELDQRVLGENLLKWNLELIEVNRAKITNEVSAMMKMKDKKIDDLSVMLSTVIEKLQNIERVVPNYHEMVQKSEAIFEAVYDNTSENVAVSSLLSSPLAVDFRLYDKSSNFLGKGSFASVFECTYQGKLRAVKIFENTSHLSEKEKKVLLREARIMNILDHENILKFFGCDIPSGIMIVELAVGSLHSVTHNNYPLIPNKQEMKFRWSYQIAKGLEYLHFHSVIHRDVKPQNVLIIVKGDEFVAKIADFGLASAVSVSSIGASSTVKMIGTAPYMAPEILDSPLQKSESVDIYAYGIMMNEVMSETRPWHGYEPMQIRVQVQAKNRPELFIPENDNEDVLFEVIGNSDQGCLAQDKNKRYSASEICVRLSRNESKVY